MAGNGNPVPVVTQAAITGQPAESARRTVALEIAGLQSLLAAFSQPAFDQAFAAIMHLIVHARGRVIVTGMGKSGLVGRKIAATLASTGTPSFYIHPAEAGHGDLGMIAAGDVVLALSWSGETTELAHVVSYCKRLRIPIVAVTSSADSTLAYSCDPVVLLPAVIEACPHDLTPTTSTTVQAVFGDVLAIALIEARGFRRDEFHLFHPKGALGFRLVRVENIMSKGEAIPSVGPGASIGEAAVEMSCKRLGATAIVDDRGALLGAFTDGDLRRSLATAQQHDAVAPHMTRHPQTAPRTLLVSEALAIMNDRNISQMFVMEGERLIGVLHLHDCLRTAVV